MLPKLHLALLLTVISQRTSILYSLLCIVRIFESETFTNFLSPTISRWNALLRLQYLYTRCDVTKPRCDGTQECCCQSTLLNPCSINDWEQSAISMLYIPHFVQSLKFRKTIFPCTRIIFTRKDTDIEWRAYSITDFSGRTGCFIEQKLWRFENMFLQIKTCTSIPELFMKSST